MGNMMERDIQTMKMMSLLFKCFDATPGEMRTDCIDVQDVDLDFPVFQKGGIFCPNQY
jgi:hypothetical protein